MKPFIFKFSAVALVAGAVVSGCSKNDAKLNTSSQAEVTFALTADNATSNVVNSTGGLITNTTASNATIKWTSAIANISRFKLEAKKNGQETEIQTKNVSNLDLFAIDPKAVSALIDTGTYREIEVKVLLVKSSGTDIPLTVKGTFTTSAGEAIPIEFDYNDNAILKAEAENVTVDATTDVTANLSLHLNRLLTAIPSTTIEAASRTGGGIVISSTSNASIYNKVIVNIIAAFEAHGFEKHSRKGR